MNIWVESHKDEKGGMLVEWRLDKSIECNHEAASLYLEQEDQSMQRIATRSERCMYEVSIEAGNERLDAIV